MGTGELIFLVALMTATGALAIDQMLPAFPEMRSHFGLAEDSTRLSLAVTLFFVGCGVGNLFAGPLADALGRKPVVVGSMVLYGAASLVASLAPSLEMLLVSRFVWGFAAAGPRTMSQAMVRDRYSGDAMARIMTLTQTVFFIAPVAAPLIGKGLLELGGWRWTMGFGVIPAVIIAIWVTTIEETLVPENKRPLQMRKVFEGFRLVAKNRTTLGYGLAVTFGFGAFYSFLGSTELVFDDIYGRGNSFFVFFSVLSVVLGVAAFISNRILQRVSAKRMAFGAGLAFVVSSGAMLIAAVSGDGKPPFMLWIVLLLVANCCHIAFFPTGNSLALEPMGALAGTAAAAIGSLTLLLGSVLGSLIDRSVNGSVTPIATGYLIYGIMALVFQVWAGALSRDPSRPISDHAG
ncbi:MAG: Bcr/CflA family efflux MFS transporter [Acidimicrobiales bacterium]|nr:Bcr/CflA family efflux MFS transporter [Acidimicrobiales bacterium]